jgi:hypothetical protein
MGVAIRAPYTLVNQPFQPAWLPGRRVNLDAAQFRVPAEEGDHPHWDMVFEHTFAALTKPIKDAPWFAENGIRTGGDYGRAWLACLIQQSFQPLPFLATVGREDCGKSIFHEAVGKYLFTRGVVDVGQALTSQSGFNAELEGALLGVIEEIDLTKDRRALHRLKAWVTARTLPIRRMRCDLYHVAASVHFYMCANDASHIPVLPGDTRIIVCQVDRPATPIPKPVLEAALEREAPAILHTLRHWRLPAITGRLRLPIIGTQAKLDLADDNAPLSVFLRECCTVESEGSTTKADLRQAYREWCEVHDVEPLRDGPLTTQLRELTGGLVRATKCRKGGRPHQAYSGLSLTAEAVKDYLAG